MGHLVHSEHKYRLLQRRLDQKAEGAPDSQTLMKILSILFSPEDAELACQLPHNLTSLETLSDNLKISRNELNDKLTDMAERGLLFDIEHRGHRYVSLAPIVVGFWEFTFMRVRPDMPLKELAHLFEKYFFENNCLVPDRGKTQRFRSFVREEAIPEYDHAEVLDWERVTHIVSSASAVSVGICQCYHTAQHLGQACDRPVETCLTFNYAAKSLIQNGIARAITKHEAIDILEKCKKTG
ncbi:MAG: 4Fe-4S ferredoxin, partial [Candidatus Electrothrix sp. AS4_5]|nr:4Fe-4S ferredoxin [Candidatus Electrothrix gigas]